MLWIKTEGENINGFIHLRLITGHGSTIDPYLMSRL